MTPVRSKKTFTCVRFVEISTEEREAPAYDAAAVKAAQAKQAEEEPPLPCGCPGSQSRTIATRGTDWEGVAVRGSELSQWPVQIKLAPVDAPYFDGADLLIAADCTAYAYGDFHQRFIRGKLTLIGCPKLDEGDYAEKLTEILARNDLRSIQVVRMEVPCCGKMEQAVKCALERCGKEIPCRVAGISTEGEVLPGYCC